MPTPWRPQEMQQPETETADGIVARARASMSAAGVRAPETLLRLISLRRIALLLLWLRRGAPSFSFLGLPASLELVSLALNALGFLLVPSVAIWLTLFAPRFHVAWSPLSVVLLLVAIGADVALFWQNWRIELLLARGDATRAIERRVYRDFHPVLRESALLILARYRSRRSLRETQHMQLALLDVARGDIDTLTEQIELAVFERREMQDWKAARRWPSYL